ncbi:hypothetical protein F5884DRAFT_845236 [Xylogone sp. PMI_703]|nr:hypothetical protein F5884DRAFT_845236 [Xylogone sp. PMI_703]
MAQIIETQTPPLIQGPSDKEKKYDRQLRLWASSGQKELEEAHILLLNSGSGTVGIETLKNLVLPGIGRFTIADEATVNEADLGVNFFLDESSLGNSRAKCCTELLVEMNPDVTGDWYPKNKGDKLEDLFTDQATYTLIMYTNPIDAKTLDLVKQHAEKFKIPLFSIHSAGFYSYFRIHLPGVFPIVDTHPDSTATTDLRLLTPWPELSEFAAELTKDIEKQSDHIHGHIPYLVLLLHYLTIWKEEHGHAPETYKEKVKFREMVAAGARLENAEGGEENFDEAVAAVLKTITPPQLGSNVKEIFDYQPDNNESQSSFWIITDAVKKFYADHKELPLPGSVPDMKAQSNVYIQLQNIYKSKARRDVDEVYSAVQSHPQGQKVERAEVEAYCKNAAFLKLIRGPQAANSLKEVAEQEFTNDENAELTMMPLSLFPIYLALTATSHAPKASASEILSNITKTLPDASSNPRVAQVAEEVARAKGGELHNISALTGGIVAQEVIKIIVKQYIPINNTCIFDGIASRTQILLI